NRSGQNGGLRVPIRMLSGGGAIRQPDSEQRNRDSRGIGEVVDTFGEHSEGMRGQPNRDQGADEKQVKNKNDAQSAGSSHVPCYRELASCHAVSAPAAAAHWPIPQGQERTPSAA